MCQALTEKPLLCQKKLNAKKNFFKDPPGCIPCIEVRRAGDLNSSPRTICPSNVVGELEAFQKAQLKVRLQCKVRVG